MPLDSSRIPVLIGIGQSIERDRVVDVIDLASRAARAAFRDAPGMAEAIEGEDGRIPEGRGLQFAQKAVSLVLHDEVVIALADSGSGIELLAFPVGCRGSSVRKSIERGHFTSASRSRQ